jgi:hypothetical protein
VPYFGNYAQQYRASFRSGEIRILDSTGNVERTIPVTDRPSTRDCRRYSRYQSDLRQTIALKESVFAPAGIGVS